MFGFRSGVLSSRSEVVGPGYRVWVLYLRFSVLDRGLWVLDKEVCVLDRGLFVLDRGFWVLGGGLGSR